MEALKKAVFLEKTGNYQSPACRMIYPHLFKLAPTAKGQTDVEKFRYQLTLLVPVYADISVLEAAAEEAKNSKWTPSILRSKRVKMPFLKTSDEPRLAELAEEFPLMIRLKAKSRPGVISRSRVAITEVDEADEVYNGRWCRASMSPFAYEVEGAGVSFGLGNVQLLDHADKIAGGGGNAKASDEFEAVGGDDLDDMVG